MGLVQMNLEALREHFNEHFDRGWLAMIIDDLPLDVSLLRQIRQLLSLTVVYPEDLPEILYGVERLQQFVLELRRHLLPVLRDRLGVSGLSLARPRRGDDRLYRQFLCMTFPYNLTRLEELARNLHSCAALAAGRVS